MIKVKGEEGVKTAVYTKNGQKGITLLYTYSFCTDIKLYKNF